MTYTNEMRPLSAMEIDFVAGAGYPSKPSGGTTIDVHQSNIGGAVALGFVAVAVNKQTNNSIILNDSPVFVEIGKSYP